VSFASRVCAAYLEILNVVTVGIATSMVVLTSVLFGKATTNTVALFRLSPHPHSHPHSCPLYSALPVGSALFAVFGGMPKYSGCLT